MKIEVGLYATLQKYMPPGAEGRVCTLDVRDGITVREITDMLDIPVSITKLTLLNGHQAPPEATLMEGDKLSLFPPIGGG